MIGSDPRRAPRGVNEWGYVREHLKPATSPRCSGSARSPTATRRMRPTAGVRHRATWAETRCVVLARLAVGRRTRARQACTSGQARRIGTLVRVLDVVLGQLGVKEHPHLRARWRLTGIPYRAGPHDALERRVGDGVRRAPVAFGSVVCVQGRNLRPHSTPQSSGCRCCERRPACSETSSAATSSCPKTAFSPDKKITYGTDGALAGIPVAATYQPNWWFKVELELNDNKKSTANPAGEPGIHARIADVCSPPET